jgi:MFS family permease
VAAVLEAAVALVADFTDRRRLAAAGQAALAASLFFLAWTTSPWGLAVGLALAGTASGIACGAAQALLVAGDPRGADAAMVRWTLFASVGDLATPVLTGGAIALGFSYRGAMAAIAVAVLAQCTGVLRERGESRAPAEDADPADSSATAERIGAALANAARRPRLWAWLFAAASCTLLDELVVAFAVLDMKRAQGLPDAWAAVAAVAFAAGATLGATLADRAVARVGSRAVLLWSSVACAAALGGACGLRSAVASCVALFAIGVTCAPHHALALARAYEEMPGRPGTVQALAQLFVIVEIAAPLVVAKIAEAWGLGAALASLVAQPLVIGLCALASPVRDSRSRIPDRGP